MSPLPIASLEDLQNRLADLPAADGQAAQAWAAREPQLTKPAGSLGRLEEISRWLSAWQGHHPPTLGRPRAHVFAGNHGVAARGVSAFPPEVTRQMVLNFQAGGAAVNQLCRAFGTDLAVHEIELDRPTDDFTQGPAMTEADCVAAFNIGMAAVEAGTDVLCIGEMGIGNTTAAAALNMALFGGNAADWVGPGTGVVSEALAHKIAVVEQAAALHQGHGPLELLRRLGGREVAAMSGAVFAARLLRVPVLLDGYICTAAAAVLHCAAPGALDHCLAAHVSAEPAHRRLLGLLGKEPLLALNMRLGEASGAALAVGILKGAVACHTGMATFAEAGVSAG